MGEAELVDRAGARPLVAAGSVARLKLGAATLRGESRFPLLRSRRTRLRVRRTGFDAMPLDDDRDFDPSAPVEVPIDGTLDLHAFRPDEVGDLVPEYLAACRERGIFQVRIVHGKGTGALRASVHAILGRTRGVRSFRVADESAGGWGATLVELDPEV